MARIDPGLRELTLTLVVYGPAKSGKTTLLHCIQDRVAPDRRHGAAPLGTDHGVAMLLDWLPLDLGSVGGWRTRVNLYAIPDQRNADATRRLVLADADGVLFAADAQAVRLADNRVALENLGQNLHDHDGRARRVPTVFMYTKQDLPAELLLSREALNREVNTQAAPDFPCSALRGEGVVEGLNRGIALLMQRLALPREAS